MLPTADTLQNLLDLMAIQPAFRIARSTLLTMRHRVPGQSLPSQCIADITRLRQAVTSTADRIQMGLLEFSLGLAHMDGGHHQDAAESFASASKQWIPTRNVPLQSLGYFAAALNWHQKDQLKRAANDYGRARRFLIMISQDPRSVSSPGIPPTNLLRFVDEMAIELTYSIIVLLIMRRLLNIVPIEQEHFLLVDIFRELRRLDYGQSMPTYLQRDIDECRIVVYRTADLRQTGLFEFRLGLEHLEDGRFIEAAGQFQAARGQWQFTNNSELLTLAEYGCGVAAYFLTDYTGAAIDFLKAEKRLPLVKRQARLSYELVETEKLLRFTGMMEKTVPVALRLLKEERMPAVARPVVSPMLITPGSGTRLDARLKILFRFAGLYTVNLMQQLIRPALDSLEQIKYCLDRTVAEGSERGLKFTQATRDHSIMIIASGLSEELVEAVVQVLGDSENLENLRSLLDKRRQLVSRLGQVRIPIGDGRDTSDLQDDSELLKQAIFRISSEITSHHRLFAQKLINLYPSLDLTSSDQDTLIEDMVMAVGVIAEYLANGDMTLETESVVTGERTRETDNE